jgi:FkbM family methyltransferase
MIRSILKQYPSKKFYSKLIREGDLCFDIGANLGAKSKLFLSLGAKVIAFETQTACNQALTQLSATYPKFEFHPFAVGEKNEQKELHLANHVEVATLSTDFIDYFQCEEIYWNKTETVQVKTLNSLIETFGYPDFCKIDVEGFEWQILSKLSYPIPLIEFEFTGGFIENTVKIIEYAAGKKVLFNFIMNENLKFQLLSWVSGADMIRIIQSLPKNRLHGNIYIKSKERK